MFLEWENNSGKFQTNAIKDVKQISLNHVIIVEIPFSHVYDVDNRNVMFHE